MPPGGRSEAVCPGPLPPVQRGHLPRVLAAGMALYGSRAGHGQATEAAPLSMLPRQAEHRHQLGLRAQFLGDHGIGTPGSWVRR